LCDERFGAFHVVVPELANAAVFSREKPFLALFRVYKVLVGSLSRVYYRIAAVAEVVCLDKGAGVACQSYAVFAVAVVIVVVDVKSLSVAAARQARVGMVEPVVVVGEEVGRCLAAVCLARVYETALSVVEEMIVCHGAV